MEPNQTLPLLATRGPVAAIAPPLLIGAVIGLGLLWLFPEKDEPAPPMPEPETGADAPDPRARQSRAASRRIMREDLAEALDYGARAMTRTEVVTALQALGFQKTAAYKALSPDGRFGDLLEHTVDGLVTWNG